MNISISKIVKKCQETSSQQRNYFCTSSLNEFSRAEIDVLISFDAFKNHSNPYINHEQIAVSSKHHPNTVTSLTKKCIRMQLMTRTTKKFYDRVAGKPKTSHRYTFTPRYRSQEFQQFLSNNYSLGPILLREVCASEDAIRKNCEHIKNNELLMIGFSRNSRVIPTENYQELDRYYPTFRNSRYEPPQKLKKKEGKMEDYTERSEIVVQIHEKLPLTGHGWIALLRYPVPALKQALSWIDYVVEKKEGSLHYVFKVCEDYCLTHNLSVLREWYNTMRKNLHLETDTVFVNKQKLAEKQESLTAKKPKTISYKPWRGYEMPKQIAWQTPESTSYILTSMKNLEEKFTHSPRSLSFLHSIQSMFQDKKSVVS